MYVGLLRTLMYIPGQFEIILCSEGNSGTGLLLNSQLPSGRQWVNTGDEDFCVKMVQIYTNCKLDIQLFILACYLLSFGVAYRDPGYPNSKYIIYPYII